MAPRNECVVHASSLKHNVHVLHRLLKNLHSITCLVEQREEHINELKDVVTEEIKVFVCVYVCVCVFVCVYM